MYAAPVICRGAVFFLLFAYNKSSSVINQSFVDELVVIGERTKRFSNSIPLANLTGVNNLDFIKYLFSSLITYMNHNTSCQRKLLEVMVPGVCTFSESMI